MSKKFEALEALTMLVECIERKLDRPLEKDERSWIVIAFQAGRDWEHGPSRPTTEAEFIKMLGAKED